MAGEEKFDHHNHSNLILIGEDDLDDKEIIEEAFAEIDPSTKIHFVHNGKDLLSFLQKEVVEDLPALIVIDYNMPGLNGAEILHSLQGNEQVRKIPKVIWSTSGASQYKSKCLALGAYDYLVKPFCLDELEKLVKYMLSICKTSVSR